MFLSYISYGLQFETDIGCTLNTDYISRKIDIKKWNRVFIYTLFPFLKSTFLEVQPVLNLKAPVLCFK